MKILSKGVSTPGILFRQFSNALYSLTASSVTDVLQIPLPYRKKTYSKTSKTGIKLENRYATSWS